MQRIQERGRDAEGGITLEYMKKLHLGYENFIAEMDHYTRVLTLDWNDYMETDDVAKMVKEKSNENREFIRNLK
jgi:deoxyadenosine/deoxycytidine kinase